MSQTLDAIRAKYPEYADVPEAKLVTAIGQKYPVYLQQDHEFAADYVKFNPPALDPYQQADAASMAAGRGKAETGMESGTELTTALANRFLPNLPNETAAGAVADIIDLPFREAGKAAVAVANIPTRIANAVRGAQQFDDGSASPNYVEPIREGVSPLSDVLPHYDAEDVAGMSPLNQKLAGFSNAFTGAVAGLTTPENALTAPLMGRNALKYFLVSTLANEPKAIEDAIRTYNDPQASTLEKSQSISQAAVINPVFAALLAHGLKAGKSLADLKGEAAQVNEKIPAAWREIQRSKPAAMDPEGTAVQPTGQVKPVDATAVSNESPPPAEKPEVSNDIQPPSEPAAESQPAAAAPVTQEPAAVVTPEAFAPMEIPEPLKPAEPVGEVVKLPEPTAAGDVPSPEQSAAAAGAPVAEPVLSAAETPVQATSKVKEHVDKVAQTEGQRPAKEVKSELVERLEKAIADAPKEPKEFTATKAEIIQKRNNATKSEVAKRLNDELAKEHERAGLKKITIDIPGDGTFTIWNTKEALGEVLKRAKRLDTRPDGGKPFKEHKPGGALSPEDWVNSSEPTHNVSIPIAMAKGKFDYSIYKGMPVELENMPGRKFYVTSDGKTFGVTVPETGLRLGDPAPTIKRALANAEDKIADKGVPAIEKAIKDFISTHGKVPEPAVTSEPPYIPEGVKPPASSEVSQPGNRIAAFGGSAPRSANARPSPTPAASAPVPTPRPPTRIPPAPVPLPPAPTPAALHPVRAWLQQRALGFKTIFAPQSIDAGAAQVGNIMRELLGEKANNLARAETAMHDLRSEFDKTPVPRDYVYDPAQPLPHNYAVIDAFERNRAALPGRYQTLARYFDDAFADRIKVIQKFAPNALQHLITNYFPHIWQEPTRAAGVMEQVATRLFAGRKEFLKERSLPMFADGLARGLKPISDNPVDLLLAKLHSMDKFIVALKAQAEFKATGHLKFKYFFEKMPDGWQRFEDPAFIVQKPPVVTIKEAYDSFQREKLGDLLSALGVSYSRVANLGGRALGRAYEATGEIKARLGASEDVLWHEAGHHLDWKYPDLRSAFQLKGKSIEANELRALVDLNHPKRPHDPKSSYDKYLRRSEEKMAEVVRAYVHAPDLFQKTAPTVWSAFAGWLAKHPDIRSRLDAIRHPGMEIGMESTDVRLSGMQVLGHWIMPDGPATVIKNYLSPGLSGSGVYRSLRAASNLLNAAQLGLSGFHAGFTSLDAVVNAVEVGLYQAIHGRPLEGAKTFAGAAIAPVANYLRGRNIQRAMLDPKFPVSSSTRALADMAVKAGLRATVDPFWQTHLTRNLMRSIHEGGLALAKTPLQLPLALVEQVMRPIAEYLVPRQKLGVFALLAKSEIERLPAAADAHTVRAALARAANATEDRMGQMTYDNLFYNRMAKDLALLSFRAYGWQLGKYRHLFGAATDTAANLKQLAQGKWPELTHRQLYFLALPAVVGAVGGTLHYLLTGKAPQTLTDYLHPSTGQQDANGNDKRLSLPSYLKDLEMDAYAIRSGAAEGGPLGVGKGLWTATYHRANPWIGQAVDLLNNRDFYGTQIWNPDDPLGKKMLAQAEFLGKSFVPFSITGAQKLREGDASARDYLLPFIGIVPANRVLTMTPSQIKAADISHAQASIGGRTREQAERAQAVAQIVKDVRTGTIGDLGEFRARERSAGVTTKQQETTIQQRVLWTPYQRAVWMMSLDDAMKVWDLANEQERLQLVKFRPGSNEGLAQKVFKASQSGRLDTGTAQRYVNQLLPYWQRALQAPAPAK